MAYSEGVFISTTSTCEANNSSNWLWEFLTIQPVRSASSLISVCVNCVEKIGL